MRWRKGQGIFVKIVLNFSLLAKAMMWPAAPAAPPATAGLELGCINPTLRSSVPVPNWHVCSVSLFLSGLVGGRPKLVS